MKKFFFIALMIASQVSFAGPVEPTETSSILAAIDSALADSAMTCVQNFEGNENQFPAKNLVFFSLQNDVSGMAISEESKPPVIVIETKSNSESASLLATISLSENQEEVIAIEVQGRIKSTRLVNEGTITHPDIREVDSYKTTYTINCK